MAKYRKKPVVIEAVQFLGESEPIREFVAMRCNINFGLDADGNCAEVLIPTLEGTMTAQVRDWIIMGVNGEFYPCKPDIFEKTYEPAEG